jgi:hypothetical protein
VTVSNNQQYKSGEPEIAVSETDPSNLIYVSTKFQVHDVPETGTQVPTAATLFTEFAWGSGTMFCELHVSHDHGTTWTTALMPVQPYPGCSDPMAAAGPPTTDHPNGALYVSFDRQGSPFQSNLPIDPKETDVAVAASFDGGMTWRPAVGTGTPIDRPFLRVDQKTGWVWENSGSSGGCPTCGRAIAYSKDYGQHWTDVNTPITNGQTLVFPVNSAVYQPGQASFPGSHFAVYDNVVATVKPPTAATSSPTASQPAQPAQFCTLHLATDGVTGTYDCTPIPRTDKMTGSSGLGGPLISADPTTSGRFAVALAATDTNGSDIYAVYTTEDAAGNHAAAAAGKALTWTAPTVVQAPSSSDPASSGVPVPISTVGAGKPWFDYNQNRSGPAGLLGLMWKAWNSDNTLLNVYSAISIDNGQTFTKDLKVTAAGFQQEPSTEGPGDDLSWMVFGAGKDGKQNAYIAWGDTNYLNPDGSQTPGKFGEVACWFARIPLGEYSTSR